MFVEIKTSMIASIIMCITFFFVRKKDCFLYFK